MALVYSIQSTLPLEIALNFPQSSPNLAFPALPLLPKCFLEFPPKMPSDNKWKAQCAFVSPLALKVSCALVVKTMLYCFPELSCWYWISIFQFVLLWMGTQVCTETNLLMSFKPASFDQVFVWGFEKFSKGIWNTTQNVKWRLEGLLHIKSVFLSVVFFYDPLELKNL